MKVFHTHNTARRYVLIFFALSIHLTFAEARKSKDVPHVEIQDKGQVVNVVWAKPLYRSDELWIQMRLSMIRFKKLPPDSHLHIEMHDADGTLVKIAYLKISQRDFQKTAIGRHHLQQTINYDTEQNRDAAISKIVIRSVQKAHDHENGRKSEQRTSRLDERKHPRKTDMKNMTPTTARKISLFLLCIIATTSYGRAIMPKIELPNEHEFLKIKNVEIIEKEGKTAINGSVFKIRNKFMPWGSHLHIDLIDLETNDEGQEEEVLLDRITYRFRRNDFDDGNKFKRFFKYIDLSNPQIDLVEIEAFTQKHTETCGTETDEPE
ncbi:hypothetical protein [Pelagicoccus sp. SDUM812005]|uniref:hypothetical protein n=1 Tax=Pelagicoccus sp. SDUM812005 TaxID=3041257 RepID=UPI00280E600A|nr:hypothetical protein [Pelagicoccus sp. SDUM812005]MDQ8180382.1 hypothetical protein [Pelagicoccus sp. SDUM812005]